MKSLAAIFLLVVPLALRAAPHPDPAPDTTGLADDASLAILSDSPDLEDLLMARLDGIPIVTLETAVGRLRDAQEAEVQADCGISSCTSSVLRADDASRIKPASCADRPEPTAVFRVTRRELPAIARKDHPGEPPLRDSLRFPRMATRISLWCFPMNLREEVPRPSNTPTLMLKTLFPPARLCHHGAGHAGLLVSAHGKGKSYRDSSGGPTMKNLLLILCLGGLPLG